MNKKQKKPQVFLIDVDGVLTTGQFLYTAEGKKMKIFGPDDNDGLSLLKPYINIIFVTGDKKGFAITRKRVVEDMRYPLELVSTINRIQWIKTKWDPSSIIYMGDGIFDHYVFKEVFYAIATHNADTLAKRHADYVTKRSGGDRAVSEACLHILRKFFIPFDPNKPLKAGLKLSNVWKA